MPVFNTHGAVQCMIHKPEWPVMAEGLGRVEGCRAPGCLIEFHPRDRRFIEAQILLWQISPLNSFLFA